MTEERNAEGESVREIAIDHLDRLTNTKDGNPRYRVVLSSGEVMHTETDAQVNYLIPNYVGKSVRVAVNAADRIVRVVDL